MTFVCAIMLPHNDAERRCLQTPDIVATGERFPVIYRPKATEVCGCHTCHLLDHSALHSIFVEVVCVFTLWKS